MKAIKILLSLAVVAGIMMTSCKKTDDAEPAVIKKATVTGLAYADLDLTEAGIEYAPAGTKIIAWVSTEDLYLEADPTATYPKKYYETTVGGDGKYSFSIEVGNNPVKVTVAPGDFWYNQKIAADEYKEKAYTMGAVSINVFQGQTKILDISFL